MIGILKFLDRMDDSKFLLARLAVNGNHVCLAKTAEDLQEIITKNLGEIKFLGTEESNTVAKFSAGSHEVLVSWTNKNWVDVQAGKHRMHPLASTFGFHFISRTEGDNSVIINAEEALTEIGSSNLDNVGGNYTKKRIVYSICDFNSFNKNCLPNNHSQCGMRKIEF